VDALLECLRAGELPPLPGATSPVVADAS